VSLGTSIKRCFISAPIGANLRTLRTVLQEKRVKVASLDDLPLGSDLATAIKEMISSVDLVIGVLTHAGGSSNVYFELGQAVALGRQVVLFTSPQYLVPFDLQQRLVVRSGLHNREAISFALDQLLAAPVPLAKRNILDKPKTQGLSLSTGHILNDVQEAIAAGDGRRLEELVAAAIRASGVDVIAEAHDKRGRADLAVWSDVLQPLVGNPLVIEIKVRLDEKTDARRVLQQLAKSVSASGAAWGLLLFGEGAGFEKIGRSAPPNILAMSVPELIRAMELRPFVEIIRERRNRRAHGDPI
jgi:hypothetical protein